MKNSTWLIYAALATLALTSCTTTYIEHSRSLNLEPIHEKSIYATTSPVPNGNEYRVLETVTMYFVPGNIYTDDKRITGLAQESKQKEKKEHIDPIYGDVSQGNTPKKYIHFEPSSEYIAAKLADYAISIGGDSIFEIKAETKFIASKHGRSTAPGEIIITAVIAKRLN